MRRLRWHSPRRVATGGGLRQLYGMGHWRVQPAAAADLHEHRTDRQADENNCRDTGKPQDGKPREALRQ